MLAVLSDMPSGNELQRMTVFLGIYNGAKYLPSLKEQLISQTFQDFYLVVVDNASTDDSFENLISWESDFGGRLSLHRNAENLGGGGTLCKALADDYIKTEWFVTFHQDDFASQGSMVTRRYIACLIIFNQSTLPNSLVSFVSV